MDEEVQVAPEQVELVPGSPEYDSAMAAKYREAQGDESANKVDDAIDETPQKPDWCPDKFWKDGKVDTEGLAKSYAEIEKSRSKPEAKTDETPKADDKAAQEAVEQAGLDWDSIRDKAMTKGELDDADYTALEEIGIPRELADEYIDLLSFRIEANQKEAISMVGGEAEMQGLMQWAAQNLTAEEINHYNDQLRGSGWRTAIDTLMFKRSRSGKGSDEPNLVTGDVAGGSGGGYRSRQEMKADMADPRYQRDPAFRQRVAEKLRVSKFEYDY